MSIQKITFEGLQAVELKTPSMRLVAVTETGPRIAHLSGAGGENLLLWTPGKYKRGEWDLCGGHRVWVTRPGADEAEDAYRPDNGQCELEIFEHGFRITSPIDPVTNLEKGIEVRILNDEQVDVKNFVTNRSELLFSAGIWALTCTVPGPNDTYMIPVGDGSDWDCFSYTIFRCWGGHGQGGINDEQWTFGNDALHINPEGKENKRMVQSHKGILAMLDRQNQQVFIKQSSYDPDGTYPLNNNIAAYIGPDNFMVEMETMGVQKTVKPNQTLEHSEIWTIKSVSDMPQNAKTLESYL